MRILLLSLVASIAITSCSRQERSFPVYVWQGINETTDMEALQREFRTWKAHGVTGVCIENRDVRLVTEASRRAHEEGLEYHAWIPCMVRGGLPHEWYAVNRLGQKADDYPAYVEFYKALDPRNPEVHKYLAEEMASIARIPDVDYVQLDYIRYPDVILARGLWEKYGLVMDEEYAPADYCYCDDCVNAFKEMTGIDILSVDDPSKVEQWTDFRCDAITDLVNEIAAAVHAEGKKISADVFPGPESYAVKMVRQDWSRWDIDMVFPMNYNDFYLEDAAWVGRITEEEVKSFGGKPVISGLFICPDWQNKDKVVDPEDSGLLPSELETAIDGARKAGAAGICLFTPGRMSPEHWFALDRALGIKSETPVPRVYHCRKARGEITVDGVLDEQDWADAPLSEDFVDIRGVDFEPAPTMQTNFKMLWDEENLYIAGIIQENDVKARLTQKDTIIYYDNDFEVFLDPDGDGKDYFEFEINALGTLMDLFIDRPYCEEGKFLLSWDCSGIKTAVHVNGTLNDDKADNGWSVEMAIPFQSLDVSFTKAARLQDWRVNFSRVEWLKKDGPEENWVWSPTGVIDIHHPDRWGIVHFEGKH